MLDSRANGRHSLVANVDSIQPGETRGVRFLTVAVKGVNDEHETHGGAHHRETRTSLVRSARAIATAPSSPTEFPPSLRSGTRCVSVTSVSQMVWRRVFDTKNAQWSTLCECRLRQPDDQWCGGVCLTQRTRSRTRFVNVASVSQMVWRRVFDTKYAQ